MSTPDAAKPNWLRIESDYRAGIKTLRQIADENGITHGAVNKRAKRDEWVRDLGPKIKAKADALVSRALVSTEVSRDALVTENAVIDVSARVQAGVRIKHQTNIARTTVLFETLLGKLELLGTDRDLMEELIELASAPIDGENTDPDAQKKRQLRARKTLDEITSIPSQIDSGKRVTEMLEKLVKMEREAHNITSDAEKAVADGVQAMIDRITGRSALPVTALVED